MNGTDRKTMEIVKRTGGSLMKKGSGPLSKRANINPTAVVIQIIKAYADWRKIAKEEETKRQRISAEERMVIHQINAQRDILMTYLERSFDERRENFQQLFGVLDRAIDTGDTANVAATLGSIVELAQSSPFKDIASVQAVRNVLADQNSEYEI